MPATVHRLEPYTMALFCKIDCDPGFDVKLCTDATLKDTVHKAMFMCEPDAMTIGEVAGALAVLKESGRIDFEDGWLELRVGMADVLAFVMDRVKEAKADESYADRQRYEELKRREDSELRYAGLRKALTEALGEKVPEIAAAASAS